MIKKVSILTCSDNGDVLGVFTNIKDIKKAIKQYVKEDLNYCANIKYRDEVKLDCSFTIDGPEEQWLQFFTTQCQLNRLDVN